MDESGKTRLILSRREGEAVHIGDDVIVEVVRVSHDVKLAIRAPRQTPVMREELLSGDDSAKGNSPPV